MKRYLAPIAAALLLSACSSDVKFTPETGDERAFWMISDVRIDHTALKSRALMRYRVEGTSPDLHLTLKPDFLEMTGGGTNFSSYRSAEDKPELYRLMAGGFELKLNPETGTLRNMRGLDQLAWHKLYRRGGEELVQQLQRSISAPMVVESIPAKVGAKVPLDNFIDMPSELTVTRVTDRHLHVELNTHSSDGRVFAQLVLERESGWMQSMLVLAELPAGRHEVRIRMLVVPEDDAIGSLDYWLEGRDSDWFDLAQPNAALLAGASPGADKVFAYDKGVFDLRSDDIALRVLHDLDEEPLPAGMRFDNVRALDADGQPLPLRFANLDGPGLSRVFGPVQSWTNLMPLGWYQEDSLRQVISFKGDVTYQPSVTQAYPVDLSSGQTQRIEADGIRMVVEPIAGPEAIYELRMETDAVGVYPLYTLGDVQGQLRVLQPQAGPPWLQPQERSLVSHFNRRGQWHWQLRLTEPADQITIFISRPGDSETRREVTFIAPDAFAADPLLPPLDEHLLFGPAWGYRGEPAVAFNPEQPATLDDSGQGAVVNLPPAWQSGCSLEVLEAEPINGHPLVWQSVAACDQERCDPHYLTQHQPLALTTDDGEQRYFYGQTVNSRLSCEGTPSWTELAYTPGARPWLVPLSALPQVDLEQPVDAFLRRYRFHDANGEQLGLLDANGAPLVLKGQALNEVLVAGRQLRLGGRVQRISYLTLQDQPLQVDWSISFPPLP